VVFEHLPPAALDHIIARGLLIEVAPGETVLTEGTRGPGLYVVLEGLVEISCPTAPPAAPAPHRGAPEHDGPRPLSRASTR